MVVVGGSGQEGQCRGSRGWHSCLLAPILLANASAVMDYAGRLGPGCAAVNKDYHSTTSISGELEN